MAIEYKQVAFQVNVSIADSKAESAALLAGTDSVARSMATSAVTLASSQNTSQATLISTADSKAVSAQTYASSADTSAITRLSAVDSQVVSTNLITDSKAVSAGSQAGVADSKAVSAQTYASSADTSQGTLISTADSKGVSGGVRASVADSKAESAVSLISSSGVFQKGGIIYNSAGVPNAALNVITWRAPFACTLTRIYGYRVGGTGATVNARRNAGGTAHLSSALSISSADTWADGGASYNDTAYAAGDKLEIMIVSTAGTVTQLGIQVQFTRP